MNQQVDRYSLWMWNDSPALAKSETGEWVRYEDHVASTKQNAPYGYYELGLRADRLQVELEAACQACTHLDEKLKEAEARAEAAEHTEQYLRADCDTQIANARSDRAIAERRAEAAEAKLQAVEALLKKPGCWSEWARECLAVLGGGK